ncbi:MAG: flagellar export protein FliJ [Fimbriimonadaceae bacterium]|nr:flagellar export protein FliJ [Fimbriimonadaceae bacterium]QYK59193.1 MAG: flagellar export protein FliJ [Fimbriimonadaceae bacterium]
MPQFRFRLEKLLEYRRQLEDDAKTAYLSARATRLEAELEIEKIQSQRQSALLGGAPDVEARTALDAFLSRLDDDQRAAESVVAVLSSEEGQAMADWMRKRQEAEALAKVRSSHEAEWRAKENRQEQAMLDDWTSSRRAA